MGCNHPVVYVTHGKGERTIALKAVVAAKISRVNSCVKVTKQRVTILRWQVWGSPRYSSAAKSQYSCCTTTHRQEKVVQSVKCPQYHWIVLLLHKNILATWSSPCYMYHRSLILCWEFHQPEMNFYTVVFQLHSECSVASPSSGLCE